VFGKPLITFAIDHLRETGIDEIWINTHHLHRKFEALVADRKYGAVQLVYEPELLETGGGIKNLETALGGEPFIVYSGDILTDIPLQPLIDAHFARGNDVTLALRSTGIASTISWCAENGAITDLSGRSQPASQLDFAGISIWSPSVFPRIPEKSKIPFIPVIGDWLKAGGKIGGVRLEQNRWFNVGTRREYLKLHRTIGSEKWVPRYVADPEWPVRVEKSAKMSANCIVDSAAYVGNGSCLEDDVILENSVLFPGSSVEGGASLRSCIVAGVRVPAGDYLETDFV
jgi:mannose-1-phosphate guanylyltransferase